MITVYARGARTLADIHPLMYGGQRVYVTVGDQTAELHLAGHVVAERPASEVRSALTAQDWAYQVIEEAETLVADDDRATWKRYRSS